MTGWDPQETVLKGTKLKEIILFSFCLLSFFPSSQEADSGQSWTEAATVKPRGTLHGLGPGSAELQSQQ